MKIALRDVVDRLVVAVDHAHVELDQFRIDADDAVGIECLRWCWCRSRLKTWRRWWLAEGRRDAIDACRTRRWSRSRRRFGGGRLLRGAGGGGVAQPGS